MRKDRSKFNCVSESKSLSLCHIEHNPPQNDSRIINSEDNACENILSNRIVNGWKKTIMVIFNKSLVNKFSVSSPG